MRLDKFIFFCTIFAFVFFAVRHAQVAPYRTSGILLGQRGPDGGPAKVLDVGAPDERQHANYIARLARGEGVPVFNPNDPNLYETYQSHQPPLYYWAAAAWSKVLGVRADDSGTGLSMRLLNVVIGVITLIGIHRLARLVADDDWVANTAMMFAGLMPMFWALHGAVSNDPLLICLCTYTCLGLLQGVARGWNLRLALVTGTLFGLALWTKTSALTLALPLAIGLVVGLRADRRSLAWVPLVLGLALVAPWWARNASLLGDPLAMRAFKEAFVGSAQRADLVQMIAQIRQSQGLDPGGAAADYWINWFGWWTARSWFGAFGQMDIFLSPAVYRAALIAVFSLVVAAYLALRRPPTEGSKIRVSIAILVGFIFAVFASFLQFNLTYFQAQGRYLYPAIGAFAPILALGLGLILRKSNFALLAMLVLWCVGDMLVLNVIQEAFAKRVF